MKVDKAAIDGLLVFQPDVFSDNRGYFFESFNKEKYLGLEHFSFVQDNISKSVQNTIRGLHYQIGKSAQGKLCSVLLGKVLDVAVDLRSSSSTYGKYYAVELSEENKKQLWIPPGFAHGFSVLSEEAIFTYKCTAYYSKPDERCIIYNDPDLGIDWRTNTPILSDKDLAGDIFIQIQNDF